MGWLITQYAWGGTNAANARRLADQLSQLGAEAYFDQLHPPSGLPTSRPPVTREPARPNPNLRPPGHRDAHLPVQQSLDPGRGGAGLHAEVFQQRSPLGYVRIIARPQGFSLPGTPQHDLNLEVGLTAAGASHRLRTVLLTHVPGLRFESVRGQEYQPRFLPGGIRLAPPGQQRGA